MKIDHLLARKPAIFAAIAILCTAAGYHAWKKGEPYQDRYWSSNRQYYVQKFSNLSFSRFVDVMPGQGSDGIDGYIRLYHKKGTLLNEHFAFFIRDMEPLWVNNMVYAIRGSSYWDDHPWKLP